MDMCEHATMVYAKIKERKGLVIMDWFGWTGIVVALIGFFTTPVWLGATAVLMGLIGLLDDDKGAPIVSMVIGGIAVIFGVSS